MTRPLRDRLADENEIFTAQEVKEAFAELAEAYGYYKAPKIPGGSGVNSEPFVVEGYEHLGTLSIRPINQRDEMINIPCLIDEYLKDRSNVGTSAYGNAYVLALAQVAIVAPEGLVEALLDSEDPRDAGFFRAFGVQYRKWQESRAKAAIEKKSGTAPSVNGKDSASTYENAATSSPLALSG